MKPLITTVAALRELATGHLPDAIGASAVLHQFETPEVSFLIAADDTVDSQRISIVREAFNRDPFVPDELFRLRREALSRMSAFTERARIKPLSLPRGWAQYKHDQFIAFFAVPSGDEQSTRWIAEVEYGDRADVIFWQTTTSANKSTLEDFAASSQRSNPLNESAWNAAITDAVRVFSEARRSVSVDVDMNLTALEQLRPYVRTYETWMSEISNDQIAFIKAPTDKSIRLRGPAGSGKTLALTLKSIREYLRPKNEEPPRILFVTHSWALAAQVQSSIDSMGVTPVPDIEVLPLLAVAQSLIPKEYVDSAAFSLVGDDSLSGKQAQLDEIADVIRDFVASDWISYKQGVSASLRDRFDSNDDEVRLALAWDLLIEFGSVIGASGIFPGAGSDLRYFQLTRASWMQPLTTKADLRVVYELYSRYVSSLEDRSLITTDQLLADFVSYLETHAWNRRRKTEGYDLIFVDEFHLFSPLERQVLHYLTSDVATYPRLFMAADPRQSPSSAFIGVAADETRSSASDAAEGDLGDVRGYELTTVHRFSPQILSLIKHIHLAFPTLFLGQDWDIDFSKVVSSQEDGPIPRLISSSSRSGEESDLYASIRDLYSRGRIAVAVVDSRQWVRFTHLAGELSRSGKFHVTTVTGRSDIEGLRYRNKGVVIGSAEHLAGLQFETVLAVGVPDMNPGATSSSDKTRLLSMLYLALSRAEHEVRVFTNEDDGGAPEVLIQASVQGHIRAEAGTHA